MLFILEITDNDTMKRKEVLSVSGLAARTLLDEDILEASLLLHYGYQFQH